MKRRKLLLSLLSAVLAALAGCGNFDEEEPELTNNSPGVLAREAVVAGDAAAVRKAIAQEPRVVSAYDARGMNLLHYAAMESTAEVVQVLIEAGADVNALDARGDTPLTIAEDAGAPEEVLEVLRANGAQ